MYLTRLVEVDLGKILTKKTITLFQKLGTETVVFFLSES